jgi:TPR repeat protein
LYGEYLSSDSAGTPNLTKAAEYFRLSADQGKRKAQYRCGWWLEHLLGVAADQTRAMHYYTESYTPGYSLAADQGKRSAQFQCAMHRLNGTDPERDPHRAAQDLKECSDAGKDVCQYPYGMQLRQGDGVEQAAYTAFSYFRLAADQGHAKGQTYGHMGIFL